MYKKYKKISIKSMLINEVLKHTNLKKAYLSKENTQCLIKKNSNKKYNAPQKNGLSEEKCQYMQLYSYNGKISKPKNTIIIYLHGGSYIEEAMSFQLKFAMKVADKTDATLLVPIYPLAPKYTYKNSYECLRMLYNELLTLNKKIIFLGDSAGGGLSLAFAMYLRDNNIKVPNKILLLSPWLDVNLVNPKAKELEKYDLCAIEGNQYAGELWAGDLDKKSYLVSPIYGNFGDLPEITIGTGEFDIMKPDCIKLSKLLTDKNIRHNYIEYEGQCHDFGILPTKEGKMLIDDFANIILDGEKDEKR